MKKVVVLTGAGVSAESGIKTFRDANGLWEGHNVMEVASPEGFAKNPTLVLNFYNQRRKQLLAVTPNKAHLALANLENLFNVNIITQNVDDLHERAGSTKVTHLHGELLKVRSTCNESLIYNWTKDLFINDKAKDGCQLRPHIVWFGEAVPMLDKAITITEKADILIVIGTSMQVYPAAGLVNHIRPNIPIYFIDPHPAIRKSDFTNVNIIAETAEKGVPEVVNLLIEQFA